MTKKPIAWSDLCVPGVRRLRPYEPGKPISELRREYDLDDVIKLASNENPLGPSPRALAAIRRALADLALYPDGNSYALKRTLSARFGMPAESITVGTGSDHILELIARAFLTAGRSAVVSQYGFAIYAIVSQASGAELRVASARGPGHPDMPYGHDLDEMAALVDDTTRVVFIANPNNPTGTWIDRKQLDAFLQKIPARTLVVVDEAYFDFVTEPEYPDSTEYLSRHENVVVLRTFSKAYGLAGIRIGYAFAAPAVTDLINRVRLSFNPNSLAQVAAIAALDDEEHLAKTVKIAKAGRAQLQAGFEELGLAWIPSVCNFVTVDVGRSGRSVFQALLKEGVIVRPLDGYGLKTHLRISVGMPEQNARLLAALRRTLGR